ncbi:hypothetical protein CSUI_007451 [Cystoisospora suis]|uniref:BED-type domain-containing protein n=1 Tax=Cystoisospora suis TaxID=483139 RepID=A0A2C6KQX2_9APIC|nr:hypothetical protein CSUI_007451 [Cystoisospora suis]
MFLKSSTSLPPPDLFLGQLSSARLSFFLIHTVVSYFSSRAPLSGVVCLFPSSATMMMLPNLETPKMLGSGRGGGPPGIAETSLPVPGTTSLSCLSSLTSASSISPAVTTLAAPVSSASGPKEASSANALNHGSVQQSSTGVHPPHTSTSCPSLLAVAGGGAGLSSAHLSSTAPSLVASFQPLQAPMQTSERQSHGQESETQSGPSPLPGGATNLGGSLSTAPGRRPLSSSTLSIGGPALTSVAVFTAQQIPASLVLSARQHSRPLSGPCGADSSGVSGSCGVLAKLEEGPNSTLGLSCLASASSPGTGGANAGSNGTSGKASAALGPAGLGTSSCPLSSTGCSAVGCSLQPVGGATSPTPPVFSSPGGDMEKSRTSFVWKYFTIVRRDDAEENAVVCNLCRVKFKTSTSTSSLAYHLLRMHQISPPAAAAKQEGGQTTGTGSTATAASGSASGGAVGVKGSGKTGCTARGAGRGGGPSSSAGTASQQGGGEGGFVASEAEKMKNVAGAKAAETSRHVLSYLVEDLLSPSIVAGTGFRELMRFLEPGYRLPDVSAFIAMIHEEYATTKQALQKEIALVQQGGHYLSRTDPSFSGAASNDNRGSKAQNTSSGVSLPLPVADVIRASPADTPGSVALSVELWRKPSSRTGSYLTVSAHYRSAAAGGAGGRPDQDLLKRVLATREVEYDASTEALMCTLKAIQSDWGLCKTLPHVVGPFGTTPNLNTAVQMLGWRPVDCFPTALSLCISRDGLYSVPEIVSVIVKSRALVEWYAARMETGGGCGVNNFSGCVIEGASGDCPNGTAGNGTGIAFGARGTAPLLRGGTGGVALAEIPPAERLEVAKRAVEQMIISEADYDWRYWKASSVKQCSPGGEQDDAGPVGGVDVCLRWKSIHLLLLAVIEFHGQLLGPLAEAGGADLLLTLDEQQLLLELVMFLKTFQDAVDVLADSDTSTISLVLPALRALRRSCMRQSVTGPMQSLRSNVLFALERRFPESEVLLAATLLDFRFKHVVEKDREWKVTFLRKIITASKAVLASTTDFCTVSTSEQISQQQQQPVGPSGTSSTSPSLASSTGTRTAGGGPPGDCQSGSSSGVTSMSLNVSSASNASGSFGSPPGAGTTAQGLTSPVPTLGVVSLPSVPGPGGNGVSGTGGRGVRVPAVAPALATSPTIGGARGQRQRQQAGGSNSGTENARVDSQVAAQQTKRRKLLDFYAALYEGEEELYHHEAGPAEGVGSRGGGPADEEENEALREEVCRYLDADCLRSRQMGTLSILQWWKINGVQFPRLARLALSLLVVPASSLGGEAIEDRRANLDSGLVDELLFLNRNRRKE